MSQGKPIDNFSKGFTDGTPNTPVKPNIIIKKKKKKDRPLIKPSGRNDFGAI